MRTRLLGRLGVWLCNRYYPRPCTKTEIAETRQYAQLVVDVLTGNCKEYGRDRDKDHTPLIAECRDYESLYARLK